MSKSQKLETCFRWVMKRYYRTWRRFSQGGKAWYAVHANDHFERGCGDCIADASAFAYLAKHLDTKMYMYVQMVTEMMKTLMDGRKLTAVFMTRFLQKPKATAEITE